MTDNTDDMTFSQAFSASTGVPVEKIEKWMAQTKKHKVLTKELYLYFDNILKEWDSYKTEEEKMQYLLFPFFFYLSRFPSKIQILMVKEIFQTVMFDKDETKEVEKNMSKFSSKKMEDEFRKWWNE